MSLRPSSSVVVMFTSTFSSSSYALLQLEPQRRDPLAVAPRAVKHGGLGELPRHVALRALQVFGDARMRRQHPPDDVVHGIGDDGARSASSPRA